jgi:FkbM family methyltransferase
MLVDGERNRDSFCLGEHEPQISGFLRRLVHKGQVILDVDARFGEFTVPLTLATGPSGQVYALEALPANYEVLVKNIELNGLTNVTPIRGVAADRDRVLGVVLNGVEETDREYEQWAYLAHRDL